MSGMRRDNGYPAMRRIQVGMPIHGEWQILREGLSLTCYHLPIRAGCAIIAGMTKNHLSQCRRIRSQAVWNQDVLGEGV